MTPTALLASLKRNEPALALAAAWFLGSCAVGGAAMSVYAATAGEPLTAAGFAAITAALVILAGVCRMGAGTSRIILEVERQRAEDKAWREQENGDAQ